MSHFLFRKSDVIKDKAAAIKVEKLCLKQPCFMSTVESVDSMLSNKDVDVDESSE